MSYLWNDPQRFSEESTEGFVLANSALVRAVSGGVARTGRTPKDRVAVVVGGGSGHYPAFAGLVGSGLADAAVMGNVFASPSAQQVYNVSREAANGGGVLLSYGNYAGDVLNFDQAQERLRAEGIPCQSVAVTDDVASAVESDRARRRGIAGDLVVFKAAAWAADQGWDLDAVTAFARRANDRTRSLGVAFSGTTLPGSEHPLFTVPAGRMAVGMGIHGEPGLSEEPLPTADEVATLLVERVLASAPTDGGREVAVLVNGLGSVKSEELFVVYRTVARLLYEAGLTVVAPDVGEFATSFEMAGISLTLTWLDEELTAAWEAPCYTPAYRKGSVEPDPARAETATEQASADPVPPVDPGTAATSTGSEESRRSAALVLRCLDAVRDVIVANVDELGRLDAVAGDGDHGIGMQRGVSAAVAAAHDAADLGAGAGTVLSSAGDAWADRAGGTSGALWGAALRAVGETFGDTDAPGGHVVVTALQAAADSVVGFGKAAVGDKTMVDALVPFCAALEERVAAGDDLPDAWTEAARRATQSARDTADLLPRMGRARPHQEKSLGTPDPGATSLAMALTAVGSVLTNQGDSNG